MIKAMQCYIMEIICLVTGRCRSLNILPGSLARYLPLSECTAQLLGTSVLDLHKKHTLTPKAITISECLSVYFLNNRLHMYKLVYVVVTEP